MSEPTTPIKGSKLPADARYHHRSPHSTVANNTQETSSSSMGNANPSSGLVPLEVDRRIWKLPEPSSQTGGPKKVTASTSAAAQGSKPKLNDPARRAPLGAVDANRQNSRPVASGSKPDRQPEAPVLISLPPPRAPECSLTTATDTLEQSEPSYDPLQEEFYKNTFVRKNKPAPETSAPDSADQFSRHLIQTNDHKPRPLRIPETFFSWRDMAYQPSPAAEPVTSFIGQGFRPMDQVTNRNLVLPSINRPPGTSEHYKGNAFLPGNQSADIPETENCSVWITNMPPHTTVSLALAAIRGCGKVVACVVNPPDPESHITTCAAKVVFFNRQGAANLLQQSRQGTFTIGGYVPRVGPNRIKSAARPAGPQSRVLHIEGPKEIVNIEYLTAFFSSKFTYDLDEIQLLSEDDRGWCRLQWSFGSYRCQAESAKTAISKEKERAGLFDWQRDLWRSVTVHFGVDPCA